MYFNLYELYPLYFNFEWFIRLWNLIYLSRNIMMTGRKKLIRNYAIKMSWILEFISVCICWWNVYIHINIYSVLLNCFGTLTYQLSEPEIKFQQKIPVIFYQSLIGNISEKLIRWVLNWSELFEIYFETYLPFLAMKYSIWLHYSHPRMD